MRVLSRKAVTAGLILALVPMQSAVAQSRSSLSGLRSTIQNPGPTQDVVEPAAIEALRSMSNYLRSANTIAIKSEASLDAVTNSGQRIQFDGTTNYKIRRPGFVIDYDSDTKSRRFIYDGKSFTVYSPKLGYYATVAAPATNRETLDLIYRRFGIALPLEDLFRWGDGTSADRIQTIKGAYAVGTATINGVETDHYAYRESDVDWEIWIQEGAQPLPRKIVIVDRSDPARPTFSAMLDWQVNPTFSDSDFTFVPTSDAKRIELAAYKGMEK